MTAADIAAVLGGARRSGQWWSCRCPVHADRTPSLSMRDGDHGLLVRCWGGCDPRDVLAELRRRGLIWGQADSRPKAAAGQPKICRADDARRIAAAMDLWSQSYRADGTIVERYLRSRGITLLPPGTIRMHGMMFHRESGEQRPGMVALVEHTEHGPAGVHITYLTIDGSMKATIEPTKRSLGPVGGGAVRLAPPGELLMVAEGIETGLAAMQACKLPVWAALSTSGLKALVLPPLVRTVIILADHDASGTGERAARRAARRWLAEGRRVRLAMPPEPGSDFNDVLVGRSCAHTERIVDVTA